MKPGPPLGSTGGGAAAEAVESPPTSSSAESAWRRALRGALLVAALLPPLAVLARILRYAKNLPLGDQWAGPAMLVLKSRDGTFDWTDLWLQHNEHRVVVPNLILLGLAWLSDWNTRCEILVSFAIALAALALLASLAWRTVGRDAPEAAAALVLVASLAQFSMAQQENWASGWQMTINLNVFAAVAAAWLLDRCGATPRGASAAMLAAVVGAYSFASGLLLLGLVPLGLAALPPPRGLRRLVVVLGAASIGAIAARTYSIGYYTPIGRPTASPLAVPLDFVRFAVTFVGGLLAASRVPAAFLRGALGLVALGAATAWLCTRGPAQRRALVPWLLLAAYAVLAGFSTAVGRLSGGIGTALVGRYISLSALFWPSAAAALALVIAELRRAGRRRASVVCSALCGVALLAAAPGYVESYAQGAEAYAMGANRYQRGRDCVLDLNNASDDCLHLICWDPKLVRAVAQRLAAQHLGPFAERGVARP